MSSAGLFVRGGEVWLHWKNSSSGYQLISGNLMDKPVAESPLFEFNSINFLTLPVNRRGDWQTESYLAVLGPHPHFYDSFAVAC